MAWQGQDYNLMGKEWRQSRTTITRVRSSELGIIDELLPGLLKHCALCLLCLDNLGVIDSKKCPDVLQDCMWSVTAAHP